MKHPRADGIELPAPKSLAMRFRSAGEVVDRLAPVLEVTVGSLLQPRSAHRDERSIFMELCRRHLCRGKSTFFVSTALGVDVSAMTQTRKRLEMRTNRSRFCVASLITRQPYWLSVMGQDLNHFSELPVWY